MNTKIKRHGIIRAHRHEWEWDMEKCDERDVFAVMVIHPSSGRRELAGYCWIEDDPAEVVANYADTECA